MTDSLSPSKSAQTKSVQTKSADMAQQGLSSQNQGINHINQLIKPIIEPIILIRRIAFAIAIATWMVMAIGSATRVMNAGLACPDWPLCYGTVLPAEQMNLQVFLEWFHRLVASTVGFATIVLCGASWYFRQSLPKWTPWATSGSFSLVVFQGILGGLTVAVMLVRRMWSRKIEWIVCLGLSAIWMAMFGLVALTGHQGGVLVHRYGVHSVDFHN
jgi:cytochrome c oxidase assembly protein subunit 15